MANIKRSVHDNEVHAYRMVFPKKTLILETAYQTEKTDIRFAEVLAYSFENAGEQNVLFEVVESSLEEFIRWYSEHPDTQQAFEYGFPIEGMKNPGAVLDSLKAQGYRYYEVNASVGLDGFVIAKGIELTPHNETMGQSQ